MSLTLEQVQHIANLARLELTAPECSRYQEQLSAILEHFERLQTVDTENIDPTASVTAQHSALRADENRPGLDLNTLLQNAPDTDEGQFRVPPVFE